MDGAALLARLRARFVAAGDPARALGQQAYMKSALPFHGLRNAEMRATCKSVYAACGFDDPAIWRRDVMSIWRGATHREERYAALQLAAEARARPLQGLARTAKAAAPPDAEARARAALAMYETLVVEGAWWDLVDEIAAHLVAPLLLAHRAMVEKDMRAWARSDDLWKRRTAILCQLGAKARTDRSLLTEAIELAMGDSSFWLRKAIGWALREYAKTDPEWVRAYVERLGERLSGLSRREALKHVTP
jgi:3-methyladenine DNA glycosylase AlkD